MSTRISTTLALFLLTAIPLVAAEHATPAPAPAPAPSQTIPDPGPGYTGDIRPDTPGIAPPTRESDSDATATSAAPVPPQTQTIKGDGKSTPPKGKN